MKKIIVLTCAVLMLSFGMAISSEDHDKSMDQKKGACKEDLRKYCKGIIPGGGRLWSCLKSNEDKLSPACKNKMAHLREKGQEFKKSCSADAKKHCKGIRPGEGRIVKCLRSNKAKLSEPCKAFFNKK